MDSKREKIIEAATRVFAEKGFYQAKISEIARLASVADGTIYLYFGNKDELLFHVFEVTLETFLDRARAAVERSNNPSEQLEQSHRLSPQMDVDNSNPYTLLIQLDPLPNSAHL